MYKNIEQKEWEQVKKPVEQVYEFIEEYLTSERLFVLEYDKKNADFCLGK